MERAHGLAVKEVLAALRPERALAYTTVSTVLDNLHRKGWVIRHLEGRAFRYEAACPRAEAIARALRALLDSTGNPEEALMRFARSVSPRESEVLRKALGD